MTGSIRFLAMAGITVVIGNVASAQVQRSPTNDPGLSTLLSWLPPDTEAVIGSGPFVINFAGFDASGSSTNGSLSSSEFALLVRHLPLSLLSAADSELGKVLCTPLAMDLAEV